MTEEEYADSRGEYISPQEMEARILESLAHLTYREQRIRYSLKVIGGCCFALCVIAVYLLSAKFFGW